MSNGDTHLEQTRLSQRVRELELMVQISRTLTSTLDVERLLRLIIKMAAQLVHSVGASIILEDARTGELTIHAATGPKSKELRNMRVPVQGSIAGTVFKTREALIVQNTGTDDRHYDEIDRDVDFRTQSILAVPMVFKNRAIGVLEAVNKRSQDQFNKHDMRILATLADQAAVAIENARLVAELQEANVRLADVDRIKSDFIAIASHELRTPLGLILGYATFLREDASGTASKQLDAVLRAATQLKLLIDDMANLGHLEAGSAGLHLSDFDLRNVIRECIDAQQQFAIAKSLQISKSLPSSALDLHADHEKTRIILMNLLNNAIKFTPASGRIEVAARQQALNVITSVTDTGIGIPQAELDRIFDRFYQVEPHLTRYEGGMGLGLSIARGMVELQGGRIWVESVDGHGSRFTFTLPVSVGDIDRDEA